MNLFFSSHYICNILICIPDLKLEKKYCERQTTERVRFYMNLLILLDDA